MMTSFYYLIVLDAYDIYVVCLVAMDIASISDGQYSLFFFRKLLGHCNDLCSQASVYG